MRDLSWEWFAGLFEGEGCVKIFTDKRPKIPYRFVQLEISSTDQDVLIAAHKLAGGRLHGPYPPRGLGKKPKFTWTVRNNIDTYNVLLRIRPYMHSRRLAKIDEALEILRTRKKVIDKFIT